MIGRGSLTIYAGQQLYFEARGELLIAGMGVRLSGSASLTATGTTTAVSTMAGSGLLFAEPSVVPHGIAWLQPLISKGGSVNYAESSQSLQPFYTVANDEYVPVGQDSGVSFLPPFATWGFAEGAAGTGVASIEAFISRGGDYNYSIGIASLKPFQSIGIYGDNYEATMFNRINVNHGFAALSDTVIFIFEASAITGTATSDRLAYDELLSSGTVESSATSTASRIVTVYSTGEVVEFYAGDRLAQEQFIQDVVAAGGINPATIFNVTVDNPLQVDGAIDALMSLLQALEEQAIIEGTATTLHDRLVEFFSYPSINDTSLPVKKSGGIWEIPGISDSRTWAVNLDTGVSSQYDGYGYNSFFERDGKYYGVADDGIYLLEGEKDAGKSIAALLDQGLSDYGTFRTKKATDVYIACASGGRLQLKVVVDGVEKVYQTNSHSNTIKEHRVQISRQQLGSEWQLVWSNQGGDDCDISEIDFHIFPMNRRIR